MSRIEKVAEFVARHFKETVEPMGYKAFLAGVDCEACMLYEGWNSPYLIPIGERAEQVVRAFEERQATTKKTLQEEVTEHIINTLNRMGLA